MPVQSLPVPMVLFRVEGFPGALHGVVFLLQLGGPFVQTLAHLAFGFSHGVDYTRLSGWR